MEIRVLQYFMAVARHENITKAAEEFHLTQPTLSRQLSDLEDELGVQLLVRGKRKTQLTEAGLIFKARAQEILSLTEKTKEQFAKMDELVAGDIYIGAGETQAMACVAKVLASLRCSYPHIQFHLVSGNLLICLAFRVDLPDFNGEALEFRQAVRQDVAVVRQ